MGGRLIPFLSSCPAKPASYPEPSDSRRGKNLARCDAKWSERTNARTPESGPVMIATATSTTTAQWRPCPICWGQRRIYQDRNGEGLVPQTCPTCIGLGEQLVAVT